MQNGDSRISVIICVYTMQRWDDIGEAVASIRRQTLAPHETIIVVDHNPELFGACKAAFPDVKVVENNRLRGLSGGRNTGISVSTGDLLAFLDDDAVAADDWLAVLARHFERPEVLGATSAVNPIWVGARPNWFPEEFMWTVGCTYRGGPTRVEEIRNVQGGAAILRRSLFAKAGGFSAGLGRTESKIPLNCEETELCIRAKAAHPGGCFLFDPSTSVGHKVTAGRATWSYFVKRCYAEGVSKAFLTGLSGTNSVLGVERDYVLRALGRGVLNETLAFFTRLDIGALKRAAAIALGLSSTGAGFIVGKMTMGDRAAAPIRA